MKVDDDALIDIMGCIRSEDYVHLQEMLGAVHNQIKREQDLAKGIKKDKVEVAYEYLKNLRKREGIKENILTSIARKYISDGEIVLEGVTKDSELVQMAKSELISRIGELSIQNIVDAKQLGILDNICESENTDEELVAKILRGDEGIRNRFAELVQRDFCIAAVVLGHLDDSGMIDAATHTRMDQNLRDNLSNLGEAAVYAIKFKRTPVNLNEIIQEAPLKYGLDTALKLAKRISITTPKEVLSQYCRQYDEGASEKVDLRSLSLVDRLSEDWILLLEKETQYILNSSDVHSSPEEFLFKFIEEGSKRESHAGEYYWRMMLQKLADKLIVHSATSQELLITLLELQVEQCTKASEHSIRSVGNELGMSKTDVDNMLSILQHSSFVKRGWDWRSHIRTSEIKDAADTLYGMIANLPMFIFYDYYTEIGVYLGLSFTDDWTSCNYKEELPLKEIIHELGRVSTSKSVKYLYQILNEDNWLWSQRVFNYWDCAYGQDDESVGLVMATVSLWILEALKQFHNISIVAPLGKFLSRIVRISNKPRFIDIVRGPRVIPKDMIKRLVQAVVDILSYYDSKDQLEESMQILHEEGNLDSKTKMSLIEILRKPLNNKKDTNQ